MTDTSAIPDEFTDSIQHAVELILEADSLVIGAGAGMGVDSGLPDFRGTDGFWGAYPALKESGLDFYDIASPNTFTSDPALAWGFYGHRLALYRRTVPHEGFGILKKWGFHMEHGFSVFTSNVDGQFQKAGFAENAVHECHGSIHHLQCIHKCTNNIWSAQYFEPEVDAATCRLINAPPLCPNCGAMARPNVLMFGDPGWLDHRTSKQNDDQANWLSVVRRPVIIELGAGTAIASVRRFSSYAVQHATGRLIRINPNESKVRSHLDVGIPVGSLQALRWIDQIIRNDDSY